MKKTKISKIEEDHQNIYHLGSDEEYESTPDGQNSPEFSESDDDTPRPIKFHQETSLTEEMLKGFKVLGNLGEGAFAKVVIAIDTDDKLYAMKKMNKDFLEENKVLENVINEQKILQEVNNKFLLSMSHHFESEKKLYFFTEFMPGKDLKHQMQEKGKGLSLNEVKMVGAQVLLGLECLHNNGYLHRDIKPENIMVDEDGYIKLADFGLANSLSSKKKSGVVGSIEYMDPSVINQTKYANDQTVDWWAFGILLYDLHYQETPF